MGGNGVCSLLHEHGQGPLSVWPLVDKEGLGFLNQRPLLLFCPYLGEPGATNDSIIQFHSAHMQVSPALGLGFSVYKKCLGLRALWDCPQCPVGILHSGANSLGTN